MAYILEHYLKDGHIGKRAKLNFTKAFSFWRSWLTERVMNIYQWEGLPDTIPAKEIEVRCICRGFAAVVKNGGKAYAVWASMLGVTNYADEFTTITFATPIFSGVRKIGVDSVLIDANETRLPMMLLIERYAVLLAHADLSLQTILINSRASGIVAATDQKTVENVNAWYKGLEDGKTLAVLDSNVLGNIVDSAGLRAVNTQYPSSSSIADFFTVQQNLLRSFYNDIGLRMSSTKRERLVTAEVEEDDDRLLFNIEDGLKTREKAAKELSEFLGVTITVKLNPIYMEQRREDANVKTDNNSGSVEGEPDAVE